MLRELPPPRQLIESCSLRPVARGSGAPEIVVVVVSGTDDAVAGASHGRLLGEVIEVYLPEGAVVEPVIAHPAVDHRALGHGRLERRMRVYEGHDDSEAFVGATNHPDAAVRLGHVLHKPVDR